jgi:hypothetical protein
MLALRWMLYCELGRRGKRDSESDSEMDEVEERAACGPAERMPVLGGSRVWRQIRSREARSTTRAGCACDGDDRSCNSSWEDVEARWRVSQRDKFENRVVRSGRPCVVDRACDVGAVARAGCTVPKTIVLYADRPAVDAVRVETWKWVASQIAR